MMHAHAAAVRTLGRTDGFADESRVAQEAARPDPARAPDDRIAEPRRALARHIDCSPCEASSAWSAGRHR